MKTFPPHPGRGFNERILVELPQSRGGYWDGDPKSRFEFDVEIWTGGYEGHWDYPWHIRVSSWDANIWWRIRPAADPVRAALNSVKRKVLIPGATVEVLPPRMEAA